VSGHRRYRLRRGALINGNWNILQPGKVFGNHRVAWFRVKIQRDSSTAGYLRALIEKYPEIDRFLLGGASEFEPEPPAPPPGVPDEPAPREE
jgi:hypothetical protein